MAEVVGGHNEVLNNEALTAHATAITAIITIKLYTRALVFVYVCSACRMEREDGLERINIYNPVSSFAPRQRARRTPYILSLGVVATQQRSCPPDLTDNTDTLCALQPLT